MTFLYKNSSKIEIIRTSKPISYDMALKFMKNRVDGIFSGSEIEAVWFLEHLSVYTLGNSQTAPKKEINNIPVIKTNRGGKMTWHGPGQKIIYLMINFKKRGYDIRYFVNCLEQYIIDTLDQFDIKAFRKKNLIGIWTKNKSCRDAKIASLGLRVSRGVIYHGISINLSCDLKNFSHIEACGIKNPTVTSVSELKSYSVLDKINQTLEKRIFDYL